MKFNLENADASVAYKLLTGLVTPRPIALVTSLSEDGKLNAAPFSSYKMVSNRVGSDKINLKPRKLLGAHHESATNQYSN